MYTPNPHSIWQRSIRRIFTGSLLLCQTVTAAWAANAVPQQLAPGQVQKQIESIPSLHTRPPTATRPSSAKTRLDMKQHGFILAGVLIEGATVFDNLDFLPFYQQYLGKQTTLDTLKTIAEAITRHYQRAGYLLSYTFLPAQHIEFGIVRLRVVEGYVAKWKMTGNVNPREAVFAHILRKVTAQHPLRRSTLNRALQDLSAIPGLRVRPSVKQIPHQQGAYQLDLEMHQKYFGGGLSIDNHGTDYLGPTQGMLTLQAYDLTGHHEFYQFRVATASALRELQYYDISTQWPVGISGTRLQFNASHTTAKLGGPLTSYRARIHNHHAGIGLLVALQRNGNHTTDLGLTLEQDRARTDLSGVNRLENQLTSVVLSLTHAYSHSNDTSQIMALSLTRGIKTASSHIVDTLTTGQAGQPDFSKLTANYTYRHRTANRVQFTAQIDGQYAHAALPALERYSLGGEQYGRAYDPSELVGDSALAGRLKLAYLTTLSPRQWAFNPYGFYDLGAVWQADSASRGRSSLASTGVGLRVAQGGFSSYLEIDKPLTRVVASKGTKNLRVFAGLAYQF